MRLALAIGAAAVFTSCATEHPGARTAAAKPTRVRVRTTAYCRNESGGVAHNAIGTYLSGREVRSAAADWSRFPLGTRFRIADTTEEYVVDDYGGAVVGTNTIDLYKPSPLEMRRWGVRQVDIDILQWGSEEQSRKVLTPRSKHACVRRMLLALNNRRKLAQNSRPL